MVMMFAAEANYHPIRMSDQAVVAAANSLAVAVDGSRVGVIGPTARAITFLDPESLQAVERIETSVDLVAIAPGTGPEEVYAITSDASLLRFDVERGTLTHESLPLHDAPITCFALSASGNYVATGSSDALLGIHVYDAGTRARARACVRVCVCVLIVLIVYSAKLAIFRLRFLTPLYRQHHRPHRYGHRHQSRTSSTLKSLWATRRRWSMLSLAPVTPRS